MSAAPALLLDGGCTDAARLTVLDDLLAAWVAATEAPYCSLDDHLPAFDDLDEADNEAVVSMARRIATARAMLLRRLDPRAEPPPPDVTLEPVAFLRGALLQRVFSMLLRCMQANDLAGAMLDAAHAAIWRGDAVMGGCGEFLRATSPRCPQCPSELRIDPRAVALAAAEAQLHQGHVALAGGDDRLIVGIGAVAAVTAPQRERRAAKGGV